MSIHLGGKRLMAKSSGSRVKKCGAKTTKGTRCSRAAATDSDYCYQHAELEKPQSRRTDRKTDSAKWVRAAGLVAAIGGAGLAGKKILNARKGKKKPRK
jgi:hypothetical protein